MKTFNEILVALDFSAHSEEANKVAVDLARRYDAQLGFVHVYTPVPSSLPSGYELYTVDYISEVFKAVEKRLAEAKTSAEAAGVGHVETYLRQGFAAEEIVGLARDGKFDLIVMGTHGRTGIPHALIGSVAERVVRLAPCPVLTVRAPKPA